MLSSQSNVFQLYFVLIFEMKTPLRISAPSDMILDHSKKIFYFSRLTNNYPSFNDPTKLQH
jgi:hypothetical protein